MTAEFRKIFLFLCCVFLIFSGCNRKVVRSEDEERPAEEEAQVTETMAERDETVLESGSVETYSSIDTAETETADTDTGHPAVDAAESDISETSEPGLLATTPAPDLPIDLPMEDVPVESGVTMSDEEMLNVAPAEPVGSMETSTSGTGTRAGADSQEYEAWFSRHGLDLNREGMLEEDSDGDGYSNRDEFLADTDPNDASSRPGFHPDFRLKKMNVVEAPVMLESVDGAVAMVKNTQTGEAARVSTGDAVPGTSLKVASIRRRVQTDKFGMEDDVSQLTVVDESTGETTTLVRNLPARTGSTTAVLVSESDPSQSITVRQGQEFEFPGEPGTTYTVIDLRETQIVIRNIDTGETWTIPKL